MKTSTLNSVLKIVIVHENVVTGFEAATALRRLAVQLEAEFELESGDWRVDSSFWKFELLQDPQTWGHAAAEASAADMIIISAGGAELPETVRDWIETVLPMKEGAPAALVALVDGENDALGESPRPMSYLRRLAHRYGLDFFCNTAAHTGHIRSGIEQIVSPSGDDSIISRSFPTGLFPAGTPRRRVQPEKFVN